MTLELTDEQATALLKELNDIKMAIATSYRRAFEP
jgi:hypothetical protein